MMLNKYYIFSFLSLLFVLSGCFNSREGPTTEQVKRAFMLSDDRAASNINKYLSIGKINVEVSENIGSKVEPKYHARFNSSLAFKNDLYEQINRIQGVAVLKLVSEKGKNITLTGFYKAKSRGDKWVIGFDKLELSSNPKGQILDAWGDKYVFHDSSEEQELLKKYSEYKKEQEILREKISEEQRVAIEMSNKEFAKKEKERKLKVKSDIIKLRRELSGTWASSLPVRREDRDQRKPFIFEMVFPEGLENTGYVEQKITSIKRGSYIKFKSYFYLDEKTGAFLNVLEHNGKMLTGWTSGKDWKLVLTEENKLIAISGIYSFEMKK